MSDERRLYVSGIRNLTKSQLKDVFSQYGNVIGVDMKNKSKGFGFVQVKIKFLNTLVNNSLFSALLGAIQLIRNTLGVGKSNWNWTLKQYIVILKSHFCHKLGIIGKLYLSGIQIYAQFFCSSISFWEKYQNMGYHAK